MTVIFNFRTATYMMRLDLISWLMISNQDTSRPSPSPPQNNRLHLFKTQWSSYNDEFVPLGFPQQQRFHNTFIPLRFFLNNNVLPLRFFPQHLYSAPVFSQQQHSSALVFLTVTYPTRLFSTNTYFRFGFFHNTFIPLRFFLNKIVLPFRFFLNNDLLPLGFSQQPVSYTHLTLPTILLV